MVQPASRHSEQSRGHWVHTLWLAGSGSNSQCVRAAGSGALKKLNRKPGALLERTAKFTDWECKQLAGFGGRGYSMQMSRCTRHK